MKAYTYMYLNTTSKGTLLTLFQSIESHKQIVLSIYVVTLSVIITIEIAEFSRLSAGIFLYFIDKYCKICLQISHYFTFNLERGKEAKRRTRPTITIEIAILRVNYVLGQSSILWRRLRASINHTSLLIVRRSYESSTR